jgi:integrase
MGVLRHMYSWAIEEDKLKRKDNPASRIEKNLPKKKQGDVVLSLAEARTVWDAAEITGYPFGTHVQLMLLTGCRCNERASARTQASGKKETVERNCDQDMIRRHIIGSAPRGRLPMPAPAQFNRA